MYSFFFFLELNQTVDSRMPRITPPPTVLVKNWKETLIDFFLHPRARANTKRQKKILRKVTSKNLTYSFKSFWADTSNPFEIISLAQSYWKKALNRSHSKFMPQNTKKPSCAVVRISTSPNSNPTRGGKIQFHNIIRPSTHPPPSPWEFNSSSICCFLYY